MQMDDLWKRFTESGSIADYLHYAAEKGRNSVTDSEGCCTDTEARR